MELYKHIMKKIIDQYLLKIFQKNLFGRNYNLLQDKVKKYFIYKKWIAKNEVTLVLSSTLDSWHYSKVSNKRTVYAYWFPEKILPVRSY